LTVRPVNLIPAEERPGGRRPLRVGPLAYIIVGALAAALIGVTALVVINGQISDRKTEVAQLTSEKATVEAQAHSLAAYTQFHDIREQRVAAVTSLADSRFDWERVLHELSLVLPTDVWLTNLTGTASSADSAEGGASISLRSGISGPALELVGCASNQAAVAGFLQALKDIDGVTRVGMQSSSLGSGSGGSSGSAAASTCQTKQFIAQFQMVVAFDAAPAPAESGEEEAVPAPESSTETTSTETTSGEEGGS
jgi:Tfp pilus assembly protein PilN